MSDLRRALRSVEQAGVSKEQRRLVAEALTDEETDPLLKRTLTTQRITSLSQRLAGRESNGRQGRRDVLDVGTLLHEMQAFFSRERVTSLPDRERTILNAGIDLCEHALLNGTLIRLKGLDAASIALVVNKLAKIREMVGAQELEGFDRKELGDLLGMVELFAEDYYSDERAQEKIEDLEYRREEMAEELRKEDDCKSYIDAVEQAQDQRDQFFQSLHDYHESGEYKAFLRDAIGRIRSYCQILEILEPTISYADVPPLLSAIEQHMEELNQSFPKNFGAYRQNRAHLPSSFDTRRTGFFAVRSPSGGFFADWRNVLAQPPGDLYDLVRYVISKKSLIESEKRRIQKLPKGSVQSLGKNAIRLRELFDTMGDQTVEWFENLSFNRAKIGPFATFQKSFRPVEKAFTTLNEMEERPAMIKRSEQLEKYFAIDLRVRQLKNSKKWRQKKHEDFKRSYEAVLKSLERRAGDLYLAKAVLVAAELLRSQPSDVYPDDPPLPYVDAKSGVGTFSFQDPHSYGREYLYEGEGAVDTRKGDSTEVHFIANQMPFLFTLVRAQREL